MDKIDLVPIKELLDKKFFIPSYQRGYRWMRQQVVDLLEDIKEFMDNGANGIYCIQPLVVKGRPKKNAVHDIQKLYENNATPSLDEICAKLKVEKWEVVDGQQRLTTIKILLSYLHSGNYELEYETRKKDENSNERIKKHIGSSEFLYGICNESYQCGQKVEPKDIVAESNIDFYHMKEAYATIKEWFEKESDNHKNEFANVLKNKVQFIWYETEETDPIKVFTRLNIGKIALTDAELIKALFLNQSNFKLKNKDAIRLQQIEIANEWDRIEYTLQNDEFWLFIQNDTGYKNPTRIDCIFDIIRETDVDFELQKKLGEKEYKEKIGNDEHQTFRYFYELFKSEKERINAEWLRKTWLTVKNYFQIFEEWYNDMELYHYAGFLIERGTQLVTLIDKWEKTKGDFRSSIITDIKKKIGNCEDLTKEYEKGTSKTACYPLLLLYNIQTVINQNRNLEKSKYGMSVFYKFPFHLMKSENWDMEHIDSNTNNPLTNFNEQKEWLKDCQNELSSEELKKRIQAFIDTDKQPGNFGELTAEIYSELNRSTDNLRESQKEGDVNEKNLIWNYCLLDSGTNRSYGNAIFPIKRRKIIQKDKGECGVSFVPPCTKNVFLKYYNQQTNVLRAWERPDAMAYLLDINNVLSEAEFINDQRKKINEIYTKQK